MKALAIAFLVFVGMVIFATRPMAKTFGKVKVWQLLCLDLAVSFAAYIIFK